jgi:phosphoribosylamine---glycine ligase
VKADGLAAGKGVVVASSGEEAAAAVRSLEGLGSASSTLVLEERLSGEEVSVIALCDGERYVLLPPAQDHKQLLDGDRGPNTGGMGVFAPALLDADALGDVGKKVIAPTLAELSRRGIPFRGAMFAGLMMTAEGPKVIEYNCRFGDPETEVQLLLLEEDLLSILADCARGTLKERPLRIRPGAAVTVVMAAHGYPVAPRKGDPIAGLPGPSDGLHVFHAGTAREGEALVTAGGRVLAVSAYAPALGAAREKVYAAVARISFSGAQFRSDIGARPSVAAGPK